MFFDTPFKVDVPAPDTSGFRFEVAGHEMQFVRIALAPGVSAVAEAGALMVKDAAVTMETVFGDGSGVEEGGLWGRIVGAGKRLLGGAGLFTTVFTNTGPHGPAEVAFAAPVPGKILPLRLAEYGGALVCQKDSFLAATRGIRIGIQFQRRFLTGLFGGEGFVLQRLDGDGVAFIHAGGSVLERDLAPGEEIHVHPGSVAAFTAGVQFDVVPVGGLKSSLFGGQGFFFARLTGPGRVWLQSLPFSRLAARIAAAMPASSHAAAGATGGAVASAGRSGSEAPQTSDSDWFSGSDDSDR